MPTNGFFYSGSDIFQDFGDFVSIDLTDPTMPALAGSLFTNEGQPDGGDMKRVRRHAGQRPDRLLTRA